MINRHKKTRKKNAFSEIARMALFIVLAIGAIKLGMLGGDALSQANITIVKNTDTETLKMALNYSLPLVNMIYNSGHISVSVSGEIKKALKNIFSFDLDAPLTILNAQSPMMYSYYFNNYQPQLAINDIGTTGDPEASKEGGISRSDPGDIRGDAKATEETAPPDTATPKPTEESGRDKNPIEGKPGEEKVTTSGKVLIQQLEGSNFKIDIDALLKEPLKINLSKSGPKALIYHTHTTEGYLKNLDELNRKDAPERTTDNQYNVVRVGNELAKWLKEYNISTIHNGTNHIEKTDTGAYERSYNTVANILSGNPSIQLVFDIHRDAAGDGKKMRNVTKVNGKSAAQIMFVVGTNKNLPHPNWKENLKMVIKLQKYLEDHYPGITRPIYISSNRYNAHVTNGAAIIEVGGDGNTIDEAVESMKYVAKAISEVIK